jgi:hypothetical protein
MLFDLRGRGRRRVVKVIYLGLALLLGGGLVLFGIGGDVQGGLFDAFRENPDDDGSGQIREQVEDAEARTRRTPNDAAAWAALAQAEFQYAGVGGGYDDEKNAFTATGRARLRDADEAWQRHLRIAKDKPNAEVAAIMTNVYQEGVLGEPAKAVRAQEVVLDAKEDPGFGDFARLAALAYAANQTRKGDLARQRSLELAPKSQRKALRQQLDQAKASGAGGAQGQAQPQAPAPEPAQPSGQNRRRSSPGR